MNKDLERVVDRLREGGAKPDPRRTPAHGGGAMTCPHCQRGTHLQNGVHLSEFEMHKCKRELTLEPMTTDTWFQPEKKARVDVPFTCGGGK